MTIIPFADPVVQSAAEWYTLTAGASADVTHCFYHYLGDFSGFSTHTSFTFREEEEEKESFPLITG